MERVVRKVHVFLLPQWLYDTFTSFDDDKPFSQPRFEWANPRNILRLWCSAILVRYVENVGDIYFSHAEEALKIISLHPKSSISNKMTVHLDAIVKLTFSGPIFFTSTTLTQVENIFSQSVSAFWLVQQCFQVNWLDRKHVTNDIYRCTFCNWCNPRTWTRLKWILR